MLYFCKGLGRSLNVTRCGIDLEYTLKSTTIGHDNNYGLVVE